MTFIITLISLVIERFFHWSHLRNWHWFARYQKWFASFKLRLPPYLILLLCILPWLIVVGVINSLLDHVAYGIFKILFGIGVLVYCMGPANLWAQALSCMSDFQNQEPQIAIERAQAAFGIVLPKNSQDFHLVLTKAIFIEAHTRLFAVIFWFVILGPVGAVMYRLIALCAEQFDLGTLQNAMVVKKILDWLPARIFTFLFSLGGHFTEVFTIWKQDSKKDVNENEKLIADCGMAALDGKDVKELTENEPAEKNALELLDRVFVMWLVILALVELVLL